MFAEEIITSLRSFTLFKSLTPEELTDVAALCEPKEYKRGDHVFLQGNQISHVFFLLQGKVRLFSMNEIGSEQTFMLVEHGELFPHIGFLKTGNHPYHAITTKEAICLSVPIESFNQLLLAHPPIHFKITQVLADKILDLQQRLEDKAFYTMEGQLVALLLRLANGRNSEKTTEQWCLLTPLTNSELAGLLGTTRETVNRNINKLKKEQAVIIREDGRISVCPQRLQDKLPSINNSMTQSEKWSSIRHHSNQCCISGGYEI